MNDTELLDFMQTGLEVMTARWGVEDGKPVVRQFFVLAGGASVEHPDLRIALKRAKTAQIVYAEVRARGETPYTVALQPEVERRWQEAGL